MIKILFAIFFVLFNIFPAIVLAVPSEQVPISSRIAVSQTGRFALEGASLLQIDARQSEALTNFIAYKDADPNNSILIGAIPGHQSLQHICKKPVFLQDEKIATISKIASRDINYFKNGSYEGCIIKFSPDQSAIIATLPLPFVNQQGDKVEYVGVVAKSEMARQLKNHLSFTVSAKDFFINLLQLSQAFSLFGSQVNWADIEQKGVDYIGSETKACRGLAAAARYLVPALYRVDFHSFISTDGLGDDPICAAPPVPDDESAKKWLAIPKELRNKIRQYAADFHEGQINPRIAYFYLPGMNAYDPKTIHERVTTGRNALNKALLNQPQGLIIDLRFNVGGSVVPMLLTFGGLLPSGKLFGIGWNTLICLSSTGNQLFVCDTQEKYGEYIGAQPIRHRPLPVAILTNWMTGSSGNIASLVLREQGVMTRVFGGATSPSTSTNATFYLLDGNNLDVMVERIYNKHGMRAPLALPVDEEIDDNMDLIFDPKTDLTLAAAVKWLESIHG